GKSESAPAEETAAAPAVETAPAAAPATVTGTTHEIKMIGDEKGYRYEPANLTVKTGDAVKYVFVSGGPHNVAFEGATLSADVKKQLDANFSAKMAELSSNMMLNAGESVTISFAGIPAGKYPFNCTPHLAMNMKGVITVE
ncbi:MAG: cupredoxin domain-containing protein, partial [Gemmatimonadetes bacterium]|nr:cupredoxin domain-containing protein [Gemmatimonadota bacterium]